MTHLKHFLLAALALTVFTSMSATSQERTHINPNHPSQPDVSPFSGAVLTDNTLYISGTLGLDENRQVPSDPAVEARNVLNGIKGQLEDAGMTMDDLTYVQIFCSDLSLYEVFNEVYRTFFTEEFPARAFIGAGSLLFGAHFEIQAIAVKR
ncbi:MAG: 2-iminobutanoate/2-iminopropanoate deaminase [Pseudohongiellaceae bacterium]|jgi:2-iminobutanoate/2-iminopropanoate deaminase